MDKGIFQKNQKIKLTLSIHIILCGVIISIGFIHANLSIHAESVVYWLCVSSTVIYVWLVYSWHKVTGGIFDPYGMFLLAAILFNGGQIALEALGLNIDGILDGRFKPDSLAESVYLVACCLSLFHLGALLAVLRTTPTQVCETQTDHLALRKVGWGLLAISIIPLLIQTAEAVKAVLYGGYFVLYQRDLAVGADASLNVLSYFFIPATLFLLAGSNNNKGLIRLTLFLIIGYSSVQFFLGFRGWATMPLAAYIWLWHKCIRPISKQFLYGIISTLLVAIFPLIAVVRNLSNLERGSKELSFALLSVGNPAIAVISEMGGSLRTVAHTIELVPYVRDYDRGVGYLYALLTVVPNVWEGVHPVVARGLPSSWLTQTVDPIIAEMGGGLGYSFIAEAYLNFGWFGAPIALCLMGFLFAKLVLWATLSGNNARLVMIACFISFSLYFARGELSGVMRQLTWYSILPYLFVIFLSRKSRNGFAL